MGQTYSPTEPLWQRRQRLIALHLAALQNATANPAQNVLRPSGAGVNGCDYCWPTSASGRLFVRTGSAWTSYDADSANYYVLQRRLDGTQQLDGENLNTGARWQTIYYPEGAMTGVNKDGVTWEYSPEDCYYSNSAGEECSGCGDQRECN